MLDYEDGDPERGSCCNAKTSTCLCVNLKFYQIHPSHCYRNLIRDDVGSLIGRDALLHCRDDVRSFIRIFRLEVVALLFSLSINDKLLIKSS